VQAEESVSQAHGVPGTHGNGPSPQAMKEPKVQHQSGAKGAQSNGKAGTVSQKAKGQHQAGAQSTHSNGQLPQPVEPHPLQTGGWHPRADSGKASSLSEEIQAGF
jgi:hypothetical protein